MSIINNKQKEILAAAELLFSRKGYEATTVQDLLTATNMSKGGFYHYFPSKSTVLNMICLSHADFSSIGTEQRLIPLSDAMERLNLVISEFIPLRTDESRFFGILFPLINLPEGRAMRAAFEDMLAESFKPILQRELSLAIDDGAIFPRMESPETILLPLLNACWRELAELLRYRQELGQKADPAELMKIVEKFRRAVESVLNAPYGSIGIIRLDELMKTAASLMN